MAEALGIAASLVQLADVTIRASLGLYKFFYALQKAQPEFDGVIIVLQDVHDAIQLLRKTALDSPTGPALAEVEAASLKRQLRSIGDELSSLEKFATSKDPSKLTSRVKWVFKTADVDRALQKLESHKTSLLIFLQTVIMGKCGQLLLSQNSATTQLGSLASQIKQQGMDSSAMRTEMGTRLNDIASGMNSTLDVYQQSLQDGFANVSRSIESSEENAGNILRQVLDVHLRPFLELAITKYETQNAARMQEFQTILNEVASRTNEHLTLIDRRSDLLANDISKILRPGAERQLSPQPASQRSIAATTMATNMNGLDSSKPLLGTDFIGLIQVPTARRNPTKAAEWSYWANIPRVGTFRIEYRIHTDPGRRFYVFKVYFWPSVVLFCQCGFSLKYSNRQDREGYVALCPSLATHPIIADSNPIWDMVACDNVRAVIARFQEKNNGPFDMNSHGGSLLMHAAECQSYKTCQFLLGQGADSTKTTACGRDALGTLVERQIREVVIGCESCSCCNLQHNTNLSLFSSTFRSLVNAGCDPDDCDILTIYDTLQTHEFMRVCLNFYPDDELNSSEDTSHLSESERISLDSDSTTSHGDSTRGREANEGQYLACIRELAVFLDSQGYSLLRGESDSETMMCLSQTLSFPQKMTFSVLQACGLSSNFFLQIGNGMETVIYDALYMLVQWDDPADPFHAGRKMTIVNLLAAGANVYETDWAPDCWADSINDGLMTPTAYAKAAGILPEWLEALAAAGYDPGQVVLEDERRRREFRWLHGVKSSAIDVEELSTSQSTIRRRAGRATAA